MTGQTLKDYRMTDKLLQMDATDTIVSIRKKRMHTILPVTNFINDYVSILLGISSG